MTKQLREVTAPATTRWTGARFVFDTRANNWRWGTCIDSPETMPFLTAAEYADMPVPFRETLDDLRAHPYVEVAEALCAVRLATMNDAIALLAKAIGERDAAEKKAAHWEGEYNAATRIIDAQNADLSRLRHMRDVVLVRTENERDAARAALNTLVHAAWEEAYDAGQRGSLKRWLSSDVRHALAAAQPTTTGEG